jgi:hypothetical protein
MLTDQSLLRLASDVSHQSLGADEDTVILAFRTGTLYTCNQTAADFLSAVDGRRTFAQIVEKLHATYDAPKDKLRQDLLALAERMTREGLLVAAER